MSEVNPADYLNKSILEEALKRKENQDVEICDFEISKGSNKGDNYLSDIFRVDVNYKVNGGAKNCSVIAKCMLKGEETQKILEEYNLFEKEREVYSKILPKMREVTGIKFGPDFYYSTDDESVFFMENLTNDGYCLGDRINGLDLNHCKLIIERMAKFHAASMVLSEQNPEIYKNFKDGIFKETDSGFMMDFVNCSFQLLVEVVKEWEGFEDILRKIEKIAENMNDRAKKCAYQPTDIKVLNHGDCWTNNAMFKYPADSQVPAEIAFVSREKIQWL